MNSVEFDKLSPYEKYEYVKSTIDQEKTAIDKNIMTAKLAEELNLEVATVSCYYTIANSLANRYKEIYGISQKNPKRRF